MSNHSGSQASGRVPWIRRGITYGIVFLFGLAIGFVPMLIQYRGCTSSLAEATSRAEQVRANTAFDSAEAAQELTLATIQNTLASATIDAQRGDYEAANEAASSFFTDLRDEVTKGNDSSLSQSQKDEIEALFSSRDELISLLARNDPAAKGRLSALYVSFRELLTQ